MMERSKWNDSGQMEFEKVPDRDEASGGWLDVIAGNRRKESYEEFKSQ